MFDAWAEPGAAAEHAPKAGTPSPATDVREPSSVTEQLHELARLRAQGALSSDEFAAAKANLLGL
jgi:Short C-terminal domain